MHRPVDETGIKDLRKQYGDLFVKQSSLQNDSSAFPSTKYCNSVWLIYCCTLF